MDGNSISTIITSVGFPIAMCLALFWYMIKQNEQHQTESTQMKEAINKLEVAIIKLTDKLDRGDKNENHH